MRIERYSSAEVMKAIRADSLKNVRKYGSNLHAINQRLCDLEREWDIERIIEAYASTLAFLGLCLGYFVDPYWFIMSAFSLMFLFQLAFHGWCLPVSVLRKLGKRTTHEIEIERQALKVLRGDYLAVNRPIEAFTSAELD